MWWTQETSRCLSAAVELESNTLADLKIESELPISVVADTEEEEVDSWRAAGFRHIVSRPPGCPGPAVVL
jgi:hypothetical protein